MTPEDTHQDAIAAAHEWRDEEREAASKRPAGRAQYVSRRRVLAEHWPDGTLAECERLEREHPTWWITWLPANTIEGYERPACWWARRHIPGDRKYEVYAPDAETLAVELEQTPPERSWHLRSLIRDT